MDEYAMTTLMNEAINTGYAFDEDAEVYLGILKSNER